MYPEPDEQYVMARISHPENSESEIEVEIVDEVDHHGRYVQIEAVDGGITLADQSGNAPWVAADELAGGAA